MSEITVGKIDVSALRSVRMEDDGALRDIATNEIIGFSPFKFLKVGPPYFDHTCKPPWYKRLLGHKAKSFHTGTFYCDYPSDEEYQRLLDERRKKDKEEQRCRK